MTTVAIVQARMSSTRLPGKVLLPLGGGTVLGCVIARLRRARLLDKIVVATSTDPSDTVIEEWARALNVSACRGPLEDVLARYALAAKQYDADTVVRITADCPLIDPQVLDAMIQQFEMARHEGSPCDYLSNALQRTFPRGLDVEVMTRAALLRAEAEATLPYEREHVTPYLYRSGSGFHICHHCLANDMSIHRWTLDTVEDYRFLVRVFDMLEGRWQEVGFGEILSLLHRHSELVEINRHVRQKSVEH
jgi:spore coat polysaccharide biosynthesis protein SpsF